MSTKVLPLAGAVDGANLVFTTPETFIATTFRLIWNGVMYESTDSLHGFAETGPDEITTTFPPETGDVLLGLFSTTGLVVASGIDPTP